MRLPIAIAMSMRARCAQHYPVLAGPDHENWGWSGATRGSIRRAAVRRHAEDSGAVCDRRHPSEHRSETGADVSPAAATPARTGEGAMMKHSNGAPQTTAAPRKSAPPVRHDAKRAAANGADLGTDRIDVRKLREVLTALRIGNFAPRMPR